MAERNTDESPAELLAQLVSLESVNPIYGGSGEEAVAMFVESWLKARGIAARRQEVSDGRSNIFARVGPDRAPALLLEAHMDTVGVGGWASGDPFQLERKDDRLVGRGACDTKASLACFMLTLAHFHRHPERLDRAIVFAASVDEESEQLGAYALAKLAPQLGVAWAVTGEPTRSDVVARHKGVGRYHLRVAGRSAHGSTPELGDNAIYKAARLCGRLERLSHDLQADSEAPSIEKGVLNVGVIAGGIGFNLVPDTCIIDIDRRFGSRESADSARAQLERISASEPGARLEVVLERPPLRGSESRSFVAEMLTAANEAGEATREREVSYMTNAVAYEEVGIPSIVFGPGDIAQAHKNDEYIEMGEMERSLAVLRQLLSKA